MVWFIFLGGLDRKISSLCLTYVYDTPLHCWASSGQLEELVNWKI